MKKDFILVCSEVLHDRALCHAACLAFFLFVSTAARQKNPEVTINLTDTSLALGCTPPTARKALSQLTGAGYLKRVTKTGREYLIRDDLYQQAVLESKTP